MPSGRKYLPLPQWCGQINEILKGKVDDELMYYFNSRCASALSSLAYTAPEMHDAYESEHKIRIFEFIRGRTYTSSIRNKLNIFFCNYT